MNYKNVIFVFFLLPALVEVCEAIEISSCTVIDQPGTYELTDDLINVSETVCIDIRANNVVFDGNNHTLDGSGYGKGIKIEKGDVVVKNLRIRDWYDGIYIYTTAGIVKVTNCSISHNYHGLFAYNGNANATNCVFENNTIGAKLKRSDNTFLNNVVKNNRHDGLVIESALKTFVEKNVFEKNARYGVLIDISNSIDLKNNTFIDDGLFISGNYYHRILNNTLNDKKLCYFESDNVAVPSNCGAIIAVRSRVDANDLNLSSTDVGLLAFSSHVNLSNSKLFNSIYNIFLKSTELNATNVYITAPHNVNADRYSKVNLKNAKIERGDTILMGKFNNLQNLLFDGGMSLEISSDGNYLSNVTVLNFSRGPNFILHGNDNTLRDIVIKNSYSATLSGDNNTISNLLLQNNTYGLEIQGENVTILNSKFRLNNHWGISVRDSNSITLENCSVFDHLTGVLVQYSNFVKLNSCVLSVGDTGIYVKDSRNITIENTTISYFGDYGIFAFKTKKLMILNSKIKDSGTGIHLSNTNASLNASFVLDNIIGIYSQNSNLTAFSNKVCGNNFDFNSTNWMFSSGDNNSCFYADGWNDSGVLGCKYSCFDCNRKDATYIRLTGFQVSSSSYNETFRVDKFSQTTAPFNNGKLILHNLRIIRSESKKGVVLSEITLTYFNKSFNSYFEGSINEYDEISGVLSSEVYGTVYGDLNGTNLSLRINVVKANDEPAYYNFNINSTLTLSASDRVDGTVAVKTYRYNGYACGNYNGNLNLSETRIEIKLENIQLAHSIGRYSIGDYVSQFIWFKINSSLTGNFDGRIFGLLSGKVREKDTNKLLIDGIVYTPFRTDANVPLLLAKITGPKTASPGGAFEYRIEISNSGSARATKVVTSLELGCLTTGDCLYLKDISVVGVKSERVRVGSNFPFYFIILDYLDPGEEVAIFADVSVPYVDPEKLEDTDLPVASKVGVDASERTLVEVETGRDFHLPENPYSPPNPVWKERIDFSDSLFSNDDEFGKLRTWLENSGYGLIKTVLRTHYDTGNISDIAIFVKSDEVLLCFKADSGYPILVNYSNSKLRFFNDTGGLEFDLINDTSRFYGSWEPHSPTFGDCFGNCLESKYGVLTFYSYYDWAMNSINFAKVLAEQGGRAALNTLLSAWNLVKQIKTCYTCFNSSKTDEILSSCPQCYTFGDILGGLLGPYYDMSRCALDCNMDTWTHSCQEGRIMKRCSKYSNLAYLRTGITADLYPNKVIVYSCQDGKWKHTSQYSCLPRYSCMDIPGSGRMPHDAWCILELESGGMILPYQQSMWITHIKLAHDPNAKYVDKLAVKPGDLINYTIEFENTGNGSAYGVYVVDTLSEYLNDSTLVVGNMYDYNGTFIASGNYDKNTRTVRWDIGEVPPKSGGKANISIRVSGNITKIIEILNYAVVYFPSVFEVTTTNTTVTIVCSGENPYIYNNTCVNCTSDSHCGPGSFCKNFTCEPTNNPPIPIAKFETLAFIEEILVFNGSASYDLEGDSLTFFWFFGDGNYSVGKVVTHAYKNLGKYNVTLYVIDEKGAKNATSKLIDVTLKGDFNRNYRIDVSDVTYVAYMVVGRVDTNLKADFNKNSKVDIGDLVKITYFLLGKISKM